MPDDPLPARPGRPRSERSRQAILDATLEAITDHGLAKLTIEGVAARAGVGKATIYRWWPSRTALIVDAIEDIQAISVPNTGSLRDDLLGSLRSLAELLATTPLASVLVHMAAEDRVLEPEVRAYMRSRVEGTLKMYARAIRRGELPPDADLGTLTALTQGPLLIRAFYDPTPTQPSFIEAIVTSALAGFVERQCAGGAPIGVPPSDPTPAQR